VGPRAGGKWPDSGTPLRAGQGRPGPGGAYTGGEGADRGHAGGQGRMGAATGEQGHTCQG
jgi:hypothetical protein